MSDTAQVQATQYLSICGALTRTTINERTTWTAPFERNAYPNEMLEVYLEAVFQMASRIGTEVMGIRMFPVRIGSWSMEYVDTPYEPAITGIITRNSTLPEVLVKLHDNPSLITAVCVVSPVGFVA